MTKEEYKEQYKLMTYEYIALLGNMRKVYPDVYYDFWDDIKDVEMKIYELQFKLD